MDETSADQLIRTVLDELPHERTLIIDLAQVTFCDSCGITALVQLRKLQSGAGNAMRLINIPANIRRVIEFSGLLGFLDVDEGPQSPAQPKPRVA
jgi:anti-anti-sigma factor